MDIPVIMRNGEVRYMEFDCYQYPPDYNEMVVHDLPPMPVAIPDYILPPRGLISKFLTWTEKYNSPPMEKPKQRLLLLKLYEFGIAGTGIPFYLYVEVDRNEAFKTRIRPEYDRNRSPMDNARWPKKITRQEMEEAIPGSTAPLYHRRMYQCDWVRAKPEPEHDETRPTHDPDRKRIKW